MTTRRTRLAARPMPDGGLPLARRAWASLRQLALGILLVAFAALVLQAPVEAGEGPHAIHQDHAGMSGHCAGHHKAQPSDPAPDCAGEAGACCQACLAVVLPAGPLPVTLLPAGESFRQEAPVLRARSPERLLRPPRPVIL